MALIVLFYGFLLFRSTYPLTQNDLALTPPMGWNTYNYYKANINSSIFMNAVNVFTSTPLKSVGYEYICSGSGWWYQVNGTIIRNATGYMTYDPERYPNGIQSMISYIHQNGLKYGHWTDAGISACNGQAPMSEGYEQQDIALFVEWEMDFIKVDGCDMVGNSTDIAIKWRDMLAYNNTKRGVVYSNSHIQCVNDPEYKYYDPTMSKNWSVSFFPECVNISNLWRISEDLKATWSSMLHNMDCMVGLGKYSGPSHWNDPDMLQIGNEPDFVDDATEESLNRNRAHFSLWCIVSAPLLMGNDLMNMTKNILDVFTNIDAININQGYNTKLNDGGGDLVIEYENITPNFKQEMIKQSMDNNNMTQLWYKTLPDTIGDAAILFLNRDVTKSYNVEVMFNELPFVMNHNGDIVCNYFDVWSKKMVKSATSFNDKVSPQSVIFLRLQNCTV